MTFARDMNDAPATDETFFLRFTAPDLAALHRDMAQAERQLAQARAEADLLRALEHAGDLGSLLTTDRQQEAARALLTEFLPVARQHPAHEPSAWLLHALATACQYCGERAEADVLFAEALALARLHSWTQLEHYVLHHWGRCLAEQRRFGPARDCFLKSLAIRQALGDPRQASSQRALDVLADHEARHLAATDMPQPTLLLRPAEPRDALCLSVLAMQVFLDTYATQGIRPALAREVLSSYSEPVFAAAIASEADALCVAELAGHLIGFAHLVFGVSHPLAPPGAPAELLRLYVQEPFTGQRVGSRLLAWAEQRAAEAGAEQLWLTPWVHNHRALAFYRRCAYQDHGATHFVFEGESHENRVLAKAVGPISAMPR